MMHTTNKENKIAEMLPLGFKDTHKIITEQNGQILNMTCSA